MKKLFDDISLEASKIVTKSYSTSFSLGILFLDKNIRRHIYSIYGFVRLADEIVEVQELTVIYKDLKFSKKQKKLRNFTV